MNRMVIIVFLVLIAACQETLDPPEIGIEISPINVGIHVVDPASSPYHFDFQFTNRGQEILKIDSVVIRGDQNCAFTFQGPDQLEISEVEQSFMRGWYQPQIAAEDQIALEVTSNSHVHPTLIVPVCGRGVPPGTVDGGAPLECQVPPPTQPDCPTP